MCFKLINLFIFIYDRERERQRHRQREKQAPRREPDAGLDPGTPGLHPGPKVGAKPLSHPGIPDKPFFKIAIFTPTVTVTNACES